MSTMDDIRASMAQQGGPVKPGEIAELLEIEQKAVASAMYQAAKQGSGIERHDDGSYSLIPGWKPARGAAAAAEATQEPAPSPAPADAPARRGRRPRAQLVKPAAEKRARKPRAAKKAKAEKPARKPKKAPRSTTARKKRAPRAEAPAVEQPSDATTIQLPRQTVRLLVAGVLAFGGELGADLREAVLEATKEAA